MSFVGASPTTCTNSQQGCRLTGKTVGLQNRSSQFKSERPCHSRCSRKGSLTGKAVVLKTIALVACGFESCPFRQSWRRRLTVWQRFAKSPRIACAGSTPVASANFGSVAQRNESATLRRSRPHVRIVPGPP